MISELLHYWSNAKRVQNGGEIEHLWFVYAGRMMPLFLMWYDTEAWKRASRLTKFGNISIILVCVFLWVLVVAGVIRDYASIPVTRLAETFAVGLGGLVTFSSFTSYAYYRHEITELIRVVNGKFLAVPMDKSWWALSRKVYVIEGYILYGGMCLGSGVGMSQFIFEVFTGTLFYDTIINTDNSYSLYWWVQSVYQAWDLFFSGLFFTLKDFIWADMFFHITMLFRVQAETIMELCPDQYFDPDEEYLKLRNALSETLKLYDLSTRLRNIVRHYMFIFGVTTYLMLSVSGIVILKDFKQGNYGSVVQSIVYPMYVMSIIIMWTTLGGVFTSGVDSVQQAMYNCNWPAAPMKVKRLLLLYKVLFNETVYIEAAPFFIINTEMLCEIFKKTYCFLTILSDMI